VNEVTQATPRKSRRFFGFILRTVIDLALALQLVSAAAYWWLSPKGFPFGSSRFWLNSVLPIAVFAVAIVGLVGMHRHRWSVAALAVLSLTSMWCAGAISGSILFPSSLGSPLLLAFLVAIGGAICFAWLIDGGSRSYAKWTSIGVISAFVGWFAVWAQIPSAASTEPIDVEPSQLAEGAAKLPITSIENLGMGYVFAPNSARLAWRTDKILVQCWPLLQFDRISRDGFWSLFAPSKEPPPTVTAHTRRAGVNTFAYSDDSVVEIFAPDAAGSMRLSAYSRVRDDTFTHLNCYCRFEISGHTRLSLVFSPCRGTEIEVLPADYPIGRPTRQAYLDDSNQLRVVEATSGEKGPYHQLAKGRLDRGDPLTIFLLDEGREVAWITLRDWSQQVSTDLSPTAGWRLPVNAIEFQLSGDDATSPAWIYISLAATGVGRGWDTVGHRAGVYRNTIEFGVTPPNEGK
jgi:hypothetical protein